MSLFEEEEKLFCEIYIMSTFEEKEKINCEIYIMSPFEEEEKIFCEISMYIYFFYGQQDFKQKDQKSVHLVLSFNLLCLQALSVIVGLQKYIFL